MGSKRFLFPRLFAVLFLLLFAFLLAACEGIPDWIYDPSATEVELTAEAEPLFMEIEATGTPIDAVSYASPTPLAEFQTPEGEPSPVVVTLPPAEQTEAELCTDPASGSSLSYDEAFAIALDSPCTAEGDLLPAHVCNENSGTWWIGLSVEKEGCNPACVVDAGSLSAEINWRCTGLVEGGSPQTVFEKFAAWRGTIHRQPHGSLVEYRFLHEDGRWFDIDARENEVRQQLVVAAWSASKISISGEKTALPDSLLIKDLALLEPTSNEPRNLSPFVMASSSSQLAADEGGIYDAWAVVDGQASQPWCEGDEGEGSGEWIQLDFTSPVEMTSLRLTNGYQKEGFLYDINSRVKTLAIFVDGNLVDQWLLFDSPEQQSINLAGDVVPGILATSLRVVIEETYPGWEFEDTCIGELEVWGRPAE